MKNHSCRHAFILAISLTGYAAEAQKTNPNFHFHTPGNDTSVSQPPDSTGTVYGVFTVKPTIFSKLMAANNLGAEYIRETQFLSKWNGTKNNNIEFWRFHKKKIIMNINNDSTPSPFPTNLVAYENSLRSFLNLYKDSIELAVIENEELNNSKALGTLYHLGSLQNYIKELTVAVNVCQEMGVPVTNGGLTGPIVASLKHYYATNGKKDSVLWLSRQMNTISNDSTVWLRADSLLYAYKTLPISYVNLHWYEPGKDTSRVTGVLQVVCNYITQQTGKKVITNETGVKTTNSAFVTRLMQQWDSARVDYCVFFDGAGSFGAQPATSLTGDLLSNGIAFRNYIAGVNSCEQSITIVPAGFVSTCDGNPVTLTASNEFSNYLWSTGDTSQTISVNATGNYSVRSILENCVAFSNTTALTVNPLPSKPVITAVPSSPINMCPNKSVKLTSSSANYYLWNSGDTTKTITVNKQRNYCVTVSDTNGCKNTSNSVVVTYQNCNPPANLRVADLTQFRAMLNWDTVSCSVGYQYQYREKGILSWTTGQVVNGSTSSRYIYSLKPSTTYEWRILSRCRLVPDTLLSVYVAGPDFTTITPEPVADTAYVFGTSRLEEKIYPVPAKTIVTVSLPYVSNDLKIFLTDLSGKVLWESKKITRKNTEIPVAGLTDGVYMVVIQDKTHKKTLRLIKE